MRPTLKILIWKERKINTFSSTLNPSCLLKLEKYQNLVNQTVIKTMRRTQIFQEATLIWIERYLVSRKLKSAALKEDWRKKDFLKIVKSWQNLKIKVILVLFLWTLSHFKNSYILIKILDFLHQIQNAYSKHSSILKWKKKFILV